MSQDSLFHEDTRDALRHAVKGMGGNEKVGKKLWPSKTDKAAGNWLSDCLNPDRAAKLEIEEIVTILRLARDYQKGSINCAMHQICDEAGYERPRVAAPKTRSEELATEIEALDRQRASKNEEYHAALKQERNELLANLKAEMGR